MAELTVDAKSENLDMVIDFIHYELNKVRCDNTLQSQIDLVVEEIYVNIANYAYNPVVGQATIRCTIHDAPLQIIIEFLDSGLPYNPLERETPDITLDEDERDIGGLGIYLIKTLVDNINYEFLEGKNILTIQKNF